MIGAAGECTMSRQSSKTSSAPSSKSSNSNSSASSDKHGEAAAGSVNFPIDSSESDSEDDISDRKSDQQAGDNAHHASAADDQASGTLESILGAIAMDTTDSDSKADAKARLRDLGRLIDDNDVRCFFPYKNPTEAMLHMLQAAILLPQWKLGLLLLTLRHPRFKQDDVPDTLAAFNKLDSLLPTLKPGTFQPDCLF
jgi:hypothetical protein